MSARGCLLSVTVSAAEDVVTQDSAAIANSLWRELAPLLKLSPDQTPPHRIIKEKRATLAHTPVQVGLRPDALTPHPNMILAGDWIKSPWPCTIEAAIISGLSAARQALGAPALTF